MALLKDFKFLRLMPLAALFYAVPALAQFEVAPDHFDSNGKVEAKRKPASKSQASVAHPAALPAVHSANGTSVTKAGHTRSALRSSSSTAGPLKPKVGGKGTSAVGRADRPRRQSYSASQIAKDSRGLSNASEADIQQNPLRSH